MKGYHGWALVLYGACFDNGKIIEFVTFAPTRKGCRRRVSDMGWAWMLRTRSPNKMHGDIRKVRLEIAQEGNAS
jgi:hypothetical protein